MKNTYNPYKEMKFWAEMRRISFLMEQSPLVSKEHVERFESELLHILGKRNIVYPKLLLEFGIGPNTSYQDKRRFLGLTEGNADTEFDWNEIKFMQFMKKNAEGAHKGNWTWRITQEAIAKQDAGWYPFFVTLTVDPKMMDGRPRGTRRGYESSEHLWKKGREFRLWIRDLADISAKEMGHPAPRNRTKAFPHPRSESDYVTYAGVLEHGKSGEHHHLHCMLWMRNIPSAWKTCPNQGRMPQYRTERECKHMRRYWPWAIASQKPALYFRSKGDIWSSLGHVTPIDKNGKAIRMLPVEAVGNYITKYMQKSEKLWNHRMKCTKNLGFEKIDRLINSLTYEQLEPLTWRPQTSSHHHSVSLIHSVPQGIVRSKAIRRCFAILYLSRELDLKNLMKTNYEHYKLMLKSVRDGARPDRMGSLDFYDWVQRFLPEITEYCEERLLSSHQLLADHFPKNIHRVEPIALGGNEVGFTHRI